MNYNIANIPVDIILNILNVVLFVVIVRLLVYKPVKKFINERKAKIDSDLDDAKKAKDDAEALRAEYEQKLAASDSEAEAVLCAARADAEKIAQNAKLEAEKEKERVISGAIGEAEKEKERILSCATDQIVETSALMAEKLLGRAVCDEDTRKIAEDFFASKKAEKKR